MTSEISRKTGCMKARIKKVKVEAYDFLARDREKVKCECRKIKIQTSVANR